MTSWSILLADGLIDELILELARFRRLFVSSRSASFSVGSPDLDPIKVGNALNVRCDASATRQR
jgi:adenylate cyclase